MCIAKLNLSLFRVKYGQPLATNNAPVKVVWTLAFLKFVWYIESSVY